MAKPRSPRTAKKPPALPAPAPPPPPEPPVDVEEEDDEEEEEEEEDDDADDPIAASGGAPGPGQYIESMEDADRLRGFDDESRQKNLALEKALMRKANGESRVMFNSRGAHKYDGAAFLIGNTQGDNARVLIEQTQPNPSVKDMLPLPNVPTFMDLFNFIRNRYWNGEDAAYKWTIYARGHAQQASDTILFSADPIWQQQYKLKTSGTQSAPAHPETAAPPMQAAPQYPQPTQPTTTFPSHPQAQMPAQPQYQQPPQYPPQSQGYPQQPPQYPQQSQGYPPQGQMPPQQYAQNPQYPQQPQYPPQNQYGPQGQMPPQHPHYPPNPQAGQGQFAGQPPWGQPAPQPGFGGAPQVPISYEPPPRNQRQMMPIEEQDFDAPEEQKQDPPDDEPENALAERLEELEEQLLQMKEQLIEQNQRPEPAPPPAPIQPSFAEQPDTVQIHRPRPMDPPRMHRGNGAGMAPPPPPAPPPAQEWQQFMTPTAQPAQRQGSDETLFTVNRALESLRGQIEGLRATVIEDRKMQDQQSRVMSSLQSVQARVDAMNNYVANMGQAVYAQGQQVAAAQAAAAAVPPPPTVAPNPAPAQAPQQSPGQAAMRGYQQPGQTMPQQQYSPQGQPMQAQDPSQLGIFSPQQYQGQGYPQQQQPQQPPPPPPAPSKDPTAALFEKLEETMKTVHGLQTFAQRLGMVPASQVAAAAAAAATPPAPNPAPEPERPSALATAASMAAGAASMVADNEPFMFKELGGYRAVYDKEGKLANWVTHLVFNADNIGGLVNSARTAVAEARKQNDSENRIVRMEQELRKLRGHEQELQNQVSTMRMQSQQALAQSQMMPPIDIDSFVDSPPPPFTASFDPAPQDIPAAGPAQRPIPVREPQVEVGPVAQPAVQPVPMPQQDNTSGMLESLRLADSLLED